VVASTEVVSTLQGSADEASMEVVSTEVLPAVGTSPGAVAVGAAAASPGAVVVGAVAAGVGVDRL